MGNFEANFKACPRIWNGSLINASGACNSDAHPLEAVQIAHKSRTSKIFLKGFNAAPVYSIFRNTFDSKAPFSKVVRTPQILRCVKPVESGVMTSASISSRVLRPIR